MMVAMGCGLFCQSAAVVCRDAKRDLAFYRSILLFFRCSRRCPAVRVASGGSLSPEETTIALAPAVPWLTSSTR